MPPAGNALMEGVVLLVHRFDNPQVNLSLELFLRMLKDLLGGRLVSVVVFGSIVFNDLAPGYGDLDFLAVMEDDPDEDTRRQLVELRKPLRNGDCGIYCHMIEGPFLSRRMLHPEAVGETVCWGTGGERVWDRNRLGWFVHHIIRKYGIVIYGRDIREEIPQPTREQLLDEVRRGCCDLKEPAQPDPVHSVDWLLLAARLLLWLREGKITSKSEAADWGVVNARGTWRKHLPKAKAVRLSPALADDREIKEWLDSIADPIREACEEVEEELACRTNHTPDGET